MSGMHLSRGVRIAVCAIAMCLPSLASAQTPDHLKCYPIKDSLGKAVYTADLGGLVPESGCQIKAPAKMLCVETPKENVQPTPPGGGPGGTPAGTFACYKVKCPKAALQPIEIGDQFGSRMVAPRPAKLLCAPASTTTTTTSSTPPTTCGALIPCCTAGQCTLYCSLVCSSPGCVLNQPCGSSTTTIP
jgi:hypothetical protein